MNTQATRERVPDEALEGIAANGTLSPHWDAGTLIRAVQELVRIRKLSVHLSSGGRTDEPIYTRADVGALLGIIRAGDPIP